MNPQALANLVNLAAAQLRGEKLPPQPPQVMVELWQQVGHCAAHAEAMAKATQQAAQPTQPTESEASK